ncbi:MAG TPA: 16S rRNA (guanine(527)-N(7))-methyltransferase RsmG [Clostridiaceae bacterium]|nr:16S rRNA (guanine(527)-N(7))-methyltransferase RsmG [Clostridiaceae bacterium]
MSSFTLTSEYKKWTNEAAHRAGLQLLPDQEEKLLDFISHLLDKNQVMDLTNITAAEDMGIKHLLDSWLLLPFIDKQESKLSQVNHHSSKLSLADVGSGAGFPGLPLKIARPQLEVVLFDSQRKRIDFLTEAVEKLEMTGIQAVWMRAEEAGRDQRFRDSFDIVTARAVAALPQLVEICLPLVKPGGVFLAMKGQADEEIDSAGSAIKKLSGQLKDIHEYVLPETDMKRSLLVIEKLSPTKPTYPRSFARIKKNPL